MEESLSIRESLTEEIGAPASALHDLGCAELDQGIRIHKLESFKKAQPHYRNAKRFFERRLKLTRLLGMQSPISNTLHEMGRLACFNKQYAKAHSYFAESLKIKRALHNQLGISHTLLALAELEYERGNLTEAERLCHDSLTIKEKLNDKGGIVACHYISGLIAEKKGNTTKAMRLLEGVYKEWTNMGIWQAELALFKLNQPRENVDKR